MEKCGVCGLPLGRDGFCMGVTRTFEFVNEHRVALGYVPFKSRVLGFLVRQVALIDEHAPYGNDPWGKP